MSASADKIRYNLFNPRHPRIYHPRFFFFEIQEIFRTLMVKTPGRDEGWGETTGINLLYCPDSHIFKLVNQWQCFLWRIFDYRLKLIMNRTTLIFPLLLLLFAIPVYAQLSQPQLDSVVKNYTQDLKRRGVDTICVFNEYCIGCFFYSEKDQCLEKILFLPTYIFWKEKGKTFMTKKNACYDYSTREISNDSFWYFYLANRDKIKKEELKIPQYIEMINGKKKIQSLPVDHGVYFQIIFDIAGNSMTKNFNSFYLTKELGEKEEHNINYEFNTKTFLNKLHESLLRTSKMEKKKLVETLR